MHGVRVPEVKGFSFFLSFCDFVDYNQADEGHFFSLFFKPKSSRGDQTVWQERGH